MRFALSVAMNRTISRLANEKNRAIVVTTMNGFTGCTWMLRSTPPDPVCPPKYSHVGINAAPGMIAPPAQASA